MKYSIITPNYNGFSLMSRYFESLENQTYKDFEVIIVDDCSSDDSRERIRDYAIKSSLKITFLSSDQNLGPGYARNYGMAVAKGDWITFIDNDDYVDNDFLETIDGIIAKTEANCYIYDYLILKGRKVLYGSSMYSCNEGYVDLTKAIMYTRNHTIGKVYKRENIINADVKYPKLRRCEDVAFVCQAIVACGTVYYMHTPHYYYVQRKVSLSNTVSLDETDMVRAFAILEKTVGRTYPEQIKVKSIIDLLYGVVLMMCKSKKASSDILLYIDEYEKKYPSWSESDIILSVGVFKRLYLHFIHTRNVACIRLLTYIHTLSIR